MLITVFFTSSGAPATSLTPTITIINLASDTVVVNADSMSESGSGFYKYDFTAYDPAIPYAFSADGGITLTDSERYRLGTNDSDQTQYAEVAGSLGEAMMAFAKGKYHFNKVTKVETLYRPDKTTVVAQRTVTDIPTEVSKE